MGDENDAAEPSAAPATAPATATGPAAKPAATGPAAEPAATGLAAEPAATGLAAKPPAAVGAPAAATASADASAGDRDRVSLAELLETIATGDRAAFASLYHATSGRLFAVALTMTRRRDVAEEVLQDAYLRIWQKARLYRRDRGQAIGWLVTIVRRSALDRLRQGVHDPLAAGAVEHQDELYAGEIDLEAWLRGLGEDVRDCVRRLGATQQRAVLLAFYEGLTHEELAARLGVPLGTAKSWVRRGLERLKTCLDDGS